MRGKPASFLIGLCNVKNIAWNVVLRRSWALLGTLFGTFMGIGYIRSCAVSLPPF
jgi:hypothetical protein